MVICHVLSSFALGAPAQVTVDLASSQRSVGHEVIAISLAANADDCIAERFERAGVKTLTVRKRLRFDPSLFMRLAALLARHDVEIVHTHDPDALVHGALAGRLAGANVVHTKHGSSSELPPGLWLRRSAARLADVYVAVTPTLAHVALQSHECDPARLSVIPNGVDLTRFAPNPAARQQVKKQLGIPEHAWIVGTVGRLAPEKDQALLIRTMAPLLDERHRLVIVGDGPERGALDALAASLHCGKFVCVTGAREDVERVLAAFDVFVLASRTGGLPLVILEAMATGLPVIATRGGGIPDVVEGGLTGFLVNAGDLVRLRGELASLSSDWPLARRIGQAARRRVLRRHSVLRMAGDYETLYQSLLDKRRHVRVPALAAAR